MATEEMFTSLPSAGTALMSDIICAVQGYSSPTAQIISLIKANPALTEGKHALL